MSRLFDFGTPASAGVHLKHLSKTISSALRSLLLYCALLAFSTASFAQNNNADSSRAHTSNEIKAASFIIPAAMVGYGVIGLESHTLQNLNTGTQKEMREHIDKKISVDDFSQYSPVLAVFALDELGIKARNSVRDRTIVIGTAWLIMGVTMNAFKLTGNEMRPDGTSTNSFPSGHTATAFMGAEFLHQEYKHRSPWIGIAGYGVAAGTGYFRMYNNRHWLTDIVAGAGIGIISTKLAYKLQPFIKRTFFKRQKNFDAVLLPAFSGKTYGLSFRLNVKSQMYKFKKSISENQQRRLLPGHLRETFA